MLRDWHADVDRRMPKAEQQRRAAAHDMTSVSDALTREVRSSVKNLLSGNIARALLLQLQFVSTEVYRSMGVIDDLLAANTATIQLLSLFPAAFLGLGVLRAGKAATIALLSESVKSTETVRREMAATLSEAHRIALLSKQPDAPPSDYALGALTLHVHIFRGRARREKARFHPSRLLRLDRALRDLFLPGLSAEHLRRLFQHVLDENDFLRLDSAQSLPRPMSLIQAGDI
ncbi:hypothetical protein M885DRAFT_575933 [Pelagophyceae sp. CCMP2097]|nr:hypothetical protein M885DRAFT_575933 [Pelagophyceae sp. CCMP2097]